MLDVGGKVVKEEHGVAKLTSKTGMAPKYNEPLDVHLNTELSGKWPKDPEVGPIRFNVLKFTVFFDKFPHCFPKEWIRIKAPLGLRFEFLNFYL